MAEADASPNNGLVKARVNFFHAAGTLTAVLLSVGMGSAGLEVSGVSGMVGASSKGESCW